MTVEFGALMLVALGGAAGAMARHAVGFAVDGRRSLLAVNVLGSLLLGATLAAPVGSRAALTIGTGFCGAFTTFSSFAVETVVAAEQGDRRDAVLFAVLTLVGAVAGVVLGSAIGGAVGTLV
ncbi:fluoride efflux transporter FluC [Haloparvum sp. PAK95]|uniref:fluoride efflux transporter FluC n=1 Tax=Haloparvum sp. PAK95 TaxID=3418962 RepID=UPI003D2EAA4B